MPARKKLKRGANLMEINKERAKRKKERLLGHEEQVQTVEVSETTLQNNNAVPVTNSEDTDSINVEILPTNLIISPNNFISENNYEFSNVDDEDTVSVDQIPEFNNMYEENNYELQYIPATENDNNDDFLYSEPIIYCPNCIRVPHENLELVSVETSSISFRKKYCFISKRSLDVSSVNLCNQCCLYLTTKTKTDEWKLLWHLWLRKILTDTNVLNNFVMHIWQFIPIILRVSWLPYLSWKYPEYRCVTKHHPTPYFADKTELYKTSLIQKERVNKLSDVSKYINDYCVFANIKCPWGCNEFLDDCGLVSFYAVIRHFVNGFCWSNDWIVNISRANIVHIDILNGARPDYLLSESPFYLNVSNLKSQRGFVIVDDEPFVLTCKNHDKGDGTYYIHPPLNPVCGVLPSDTSDHFASVVVNMKSAKILKSHKYSTTYHVNRIHGGYDGIDSCDLTSAGNFSTDEIKHWELQHLALYHRPDLQQHFYVLVQNGVLSKDMADKYIAISKKKYNLEHQPVNNIYSIKDATLGATFISTVDAIKMEMLYKKNKHCMGDINDDNALLSNEEISIEQLNIIENPLNIIDIQHDDNILANSESLDSDFSFTSTGTLILPDHDNDNSVLQDSVSNNRLEHRIDEVIDDRLRTWKPPWPVTWIHVHTCDTYGWRPAFLPRISNKQSNTSTIWLLNSMVSSVVQVYEALTKMLNSTSDVKPHGHYLSYFIYNVLPSIKQRPCKFCPYKSLSMKKLLPIMKTEFSNEVSNFISGIEGVDSFFLNDNDDIREIDQFSFTEVETVVFFRKPGKYSVDQYLDNFEIQTVNGCISYRCQYVARINRSGEDPILNEWNAVACYRNMETMFTNWWISENNKLPFKAYDYSKHRVTSSRISRLGNTYICDSVNYLPPDITQQWQILVFVKTCKTEILDKKKDYLLAMGGQLKVKCYKHKVPLVNSSSKTNMYCCYKKDVQTCCDKKAHVECPYGCLVYCCSHHIRELNVQPIEHYVSDRADTKNSIHLNYVNDTTEGIDSDFNETDNSIMNGSIQTFDEYNGDNSSLNTTIKKYDSINTEDATAEEDDNDNFIPATETTETFIPDTAPGNVLVDYNPMDDVTNHISSDYIHLDEDFTCLPCTSFKKQPHGQVIDTPLASNNRMRSHTLINSFGGALMRKGSRLKGTRGEMGFLQKLVSQNGISIPLLYAESMLFPSLFWKSNEDGSMIGSLTGHLWSNKRQCKLYNITGAKEHYLSRLSNHSLMTSSDSRYLFHSTDVLSNINMRGFDCRLTMRRGLEALFGDKGPTFINLEKANDSQMYACDVIDGRRSVHCLAAMLKEKATYFTTYTLNERLHPGIERLVTIRDKEIEAASNNCHGDEKQFNYLKRSILQASMGPILRSWMKIMVQVVRHITESIIDKPYGECVKFFGRFEFQEGDSKVSGSYPHFHLILWTKEESEKVINDRIRCSSHQLCNTKDKIQLIIQQILKSRYNPNDANAAEQLEKACGLPDIDNQIMEFRNLSGILQTHNCERVYFRCNRMTKNGMVCRYVDHYLVNPVPVEYYKKTFDIKHSEKAENILLDLDLLKKNEYQNVVSNHPLMKSEKYYYPAEKKERFSPTHFLHFAFTQSNQNVVRTSWAMTAKYLAKYVASMDENARLLIRADQKREDAIKMEVEQLGNTKIAGSSIALKNKHKADRPRHQLVGQVLSATQALTLQLGSPTVMCSEVFVNVPTVSLENRSGIIKSPRRYTVMNHAVSGNDHLYSVLHHEPIAGVFIQRGALPAVETRKNLHLVDHRQFTHNQQLTIADQIFSQVMIDATSTFAVRPPELSFIDRQEDYLCNFVIKNINKRNKNNMDTITTENISFTCVKHSCWIDGLERKIFIRRCSLRRILDLYYQSSILRFTHQQQLMMSHFVIIALALYEVVFGIQYNRLHLEDNDFDINPADRLKVDQLITYQPLIDNHLLPLQKDAYNLKVAIPIYRPTKPSEPIAFLTHILLSMGRFITEIDIWTCTSFAKMFYTAKLIPTETPTHEHVNYILKSYIVDQLMFTTSGKKIMDDCIVMAKRCLSDALLHNKISIEGIPPCLYTSLRYKISETCNNFHRESRRAIAESAYDSALIDAMTVNELSQVPSLDDIISATKNNPLDWIPIVKIMEGQKTASFREQTVIINDINRAICSYINCEPTPNILIHGAPGAGKSFIATKLQVLHALSKGLTVLTTSISAELSQELGGIHIHKLFKLKPFYKDNLYKVADKCIVKLFKDTTGYLYLLQTIDVLIVDEIGMCSAELLSVLDIILRYIRNSSQYMGGILIIGTFDIEQLSCIGGFPFLLSANVLTNFKFYDLKNFVRSRHDTQLQILQLLCRKGELTPEDVVIFSQLIRLCKHVSRWDSKEITSDMMQIYGKRQAVNNALKHYIKRFVKGKVIKVKAKDEETARTALDDWKQASVHSTRTLNQNKSGVKEPATLSLYENAILEFTCNKTNTFSQGQICIARSIPNEDHLKLDDATFMVHVAPVGTRRPPDNLDTMSKASLVDKGWKILELRKSTNPNIVSSKDRLIRRTQFPVRSRVTSTVHKIIGKTCGKIVTQISCIKSHQFALWSKEQLVVLLSRTEFINDMMFVNPKGVEDTIQILLYLLKKVNQYYYHSKHIIQCKTTINGECSDIIPIAPILNYEAFPFRIKDVELPTSTPNGFCYLLWSLSDQNVTYIGQTTNIVKRLKEHNRRFQQTTLDSTNAVDLGSKGNDKRNAPVEFAPWAMAGYIYGFENKHHLNLREVFERRWQFALRHAILNSVFILSVVEVFNIAHAIAAEFIQLHQPGARLHFVLCLTPRIEK